MQVFLGADIHTSMYIHSLDRETKTLSSGCGLYRKGYRQKKKVSAYISEKGGWLNARVD